MILDSRIAPSEQTAKAHPIYATSVTTDEVFVWIQPPISLDPPDTSGATIVNGIYAQTKHVEALSVLDRGLASEFAAWEAASDEALNLFELESS